MIFLVVLEEAAAGLLDVWSKVAGLWGEFTVQG